MESTLWKSIKSLEEPFNDAFNYKTRAQKEFFNRLFLRTRDLSKCLEPSIYYLMGEKGTGKTAYAVYHENNPDNGYQSQVTVMTETQYKRFIQLKKQGKLDYSDYANIWRSMLMFIVGRMVVKHEKVLLDNITRRFHGVESAVKKWSKNALNPEVESAFEAIITQSMNLSGGKKDVAATGVERKAQNTEKVSQIRHYLLETENSFKESLNSLSLKKNHVLFLDGIDYRPESVNYADYLECVKGLGEAVWQLNSEYFGSIRDSKGRIKIVLLVRPDVFHLLNLYNSNSRIQDNTVFLDWSTTEKELKDSELFNVCGKYFSVQHSSRPDPSTAWDHYYGEDKTDHAVFKRLLRITFQKPRDILTFIKIARSNIIKSGKGDESSFPLDILTNPAVTRDFSDYLLGEVRNYAAFYMTQTDFSLYMKFFQFLDGKSRFDMSFFDSAFVKFKNWSRGENWSAREYLRDAEALLQFFYDVNVIGYSESVEGNTGGGEQFVHWSYRERTLNNIAPKVKTSGTLIINIGIAKALDIGKQVTVQAPVRDSPRSGIQRKNRKSKRGRNQPRKSSTNV